MKKEDCGLAIYTAIIWELVSTVMIRKKALVITSSACFISFCHLLWVTVGQKQNRIENNSTMKSFGASFGPYKIQILSVVYIPSNNVHYPFYLSNNELDVTEIQGALDYVRNSKLRISIMNGIVRSSRSMLMSISIVECKAISKFLMVELISVHVGWLRRCLNFQGTLPILVTVSSIKDFNFQGT